VASIELAIESGAKKTVGGIQEIRNWIFKGSSSEIPQPKTRVRHISIRGLRHPRHNGHENLRAAKPAAEEKYLRHAVSGFI
jgi:hypothetical protein